MSLMENKGQQFLPFEKAKKTKHSRKPTTIDDYIHQKQMHKSPNFISKDNLVTKEVESGNVQVYSGKFNVTAQHKR